MAWASQAQETQQAVTLLRATPQRARVTGTATHARPEPTGRRPGPPPAPWVLGPAQSHPPQPGGGFCVVLQQEGALLESPHGLLVTINPAGGRGRRVPMQSGTYLMAHKSGLEGRAASGMRPRLQIYAPDGRTWATQLWTKREQPGPHGAGSEASPSAPRPWVSIWDVWGQHRSTTGE